MSYQEHAEAIVEGVLDAWKQYYDWSGELYVHGEPIEPFFSTKVAESLFRSFSDTCRVRLEQSVSRISNGSDAEGTRGRIPQGLRNAGRVDVCFLNKGDKPEGIIELKRHFNASNHKADVERIVKMLDRLGKKKGGSLRWGAIAAMHTVWQPDRTVEAKFKRSSEALRRMLKGHNVTEVMKSHYLPDPVANADGETFYACAGLCFLIY